MKLRTRIKRLLINNLGRLRYLKYMNRGIIFAFDLLFSVTGTILSYLIITMLIGRMAVRHEVLIIAICSAVISALIFASAGLYKVIIRHATLKGMSQIVGLTLIKVIVMGLVIYQLDYFGLRLLFFWAFIDLMITSFILITIRSFIINIYDTVLNLNCKYKKNAFVYSTLGRSPMLVSQINANLDLPYRVVGILTTNKSKNNIVISGEKVSYIEENLSNLDKLVRVNQVEYIIFSSFDRFNKERDHLVEYCIKNHIKIMMLDDLRELDDNNSHPIIKPIEIEDLLERDEIIIETDKISQEMDGKVILVSGAAGSIGREITLQLVKFNVKELVLLDNSETPLHDLRLELNELFPAVKTHFYLGDVRSKERVMRIFRDHRPSIIFHAAAYKHVPMIESNPCEAILANVWGTINMSRNAIEWDVDKFIMISTDKAINPTNVMGASKRIAEMYVQSLNKSANHRTQFVTTRFGNVLGSNGSVIPYFKKQIAAGGPVTVTHPDIIRYFMTIPEACRLVLQAATMGTGGEIFIFDMGQQVKIADLAKRMILLSGLVPDVDIKIAFTGLRPGEKLYEEVLSDKETTIETTHNKIRISMVEPTDYDILSTNLRPLIRNAVRVNVDESIKIMKLIVPEFISNNSEFEKFDKK